MSVYSDPDNPDGYIVDYYEDENGTAFVRTRPVPPGSLNSGAVAVPEVEVPVEEMLVEREV